MKSEELNKKVGKTYLQCLEKYEEKGNDLFFYLKEGYPKRASKDRVLLSGEEIVKNIYAHLFQDESIDEHRVYNVNFDKRLYKVEKEHRYFCLNCSTPIFFEKGGSFDCSHCAWINELDQKFPTTDPWGDDNGFYEPIVIKSKVLKNHSSQICYPTIEKSDLNALPEKLRAAVLTYLKEPENCTKAMKDNIYHNLYRKDMHKFWSISEKYASKAKIASFFQFTKSEFNRIKCPHCSAGFWLNPEYYDGPPPVTGNLYCDSCGKTFTL